jgi:ribosomal protein L12E/L44/L45/RPP1/RPP2
MGFSNKSLSSTLAVLAVGGLFTLGVCDLSKVELETTKQQLTAVSSERDSLKGQVSTLQSQLDSTKKELDDARAKLAAAPAPAPEPAAPAPTAKKTTSKKEAVANPAAQPKTEAAKEQMKQDTGASHFKR